MHTVQQTVMVVEDESSDRELIRIAFDKIGFKGRLHMAASGEEAISYLMGEGAYADRVIHPYPTLIITDLKMPEGDGFTLLEHLKGNPSWAVIPTIVLSSSGDPDDVRQAYLLGGSAYDRKPSDFNGLRELIRLVHNYWMTCLIPLLEASGQHAHTEREGKLGARFVRPRRARQHRV